MLLDELQYDTLDIEVLNQEKEPLLLQSEQSLDYYIDEKFVEPYLIQNGESETEYSTFLTAYNTVSKLEDVFYGDIYQGVPVADVINDIMDGIGVEYEVNTAKAIDLTGYLPISTKRQALQSVLFSSNLRLYIEDNKWVFRPMYSEVSDFVYDESNILENPKTKTIKTKDIVNVKYETWHLTNVNDELFRGNLDDQQIIRVNFENPYDLVNIFEVVGKDENGNEILAPTDYINNIKILQNTANTVQIQNIGNVKNTVVIFSQKYVKSEEEQEFRTEFATDESEKEEYSLSLVGNLSDFGAEMLKINQKSTEITFNTLVKPSLGVKYNILGKDLIVTKVSTIFNGVYTVEAK
jgi:hypothetical protein